MENKTNKKKLDKKVKVDKVKISQEKKFEEEWNSILKSLGIKTYSLA